MKVCTVWGDLSSEKSSENYPTEVFCDECYEQMSMVKEGEESGIISEQEYDESWGDTCSQCGKTVDQELEERSM
ncbi:hypothetical protein [Reichenbachiella sp.]|uniref:hypothetical protein n=1 Tax=Reichenbachiella sp. TaxID=2184521 RepID=UPI00329849DE